MEKNCVKTPETLVNKGIATRGGGGLYVNNTKTFGMCARCGSEP